MAKPVSRFERLREGARALLDESGLRPQERLSRLHRFIHFCVLVGRSFSRNRCPVRAWPWPTPPSWRSFPCWPWS